MERRTINPALTSGRQRPIALQSQPPESDRNDKLPWEACSGGFWEGWRASPPEPY